MTRALVSGIGQSAIGRRLGRSGASLTAEAALAAIADAGLARGDIDGISTWPGASGPTPGFTGAGVFDVKDMLGLEVGWFAGGSETAGQLGAVVNAVAAVEAGLATHVLCFRTVWEATAAAQARDRRASVLTSGGQPATGWSQWLTPFGAVSAANWSAMMATRHFHDYGTTKAQLGALAVNQRRNAHLNPHAIWRDPITLEDYLAARPISDPLGLLDCDTPCDGSTAVIVSRGDTVADLPHPAVRIESVGCALRSRPRWDQWTSLADLPAFDVGADLWQRSQLRPADVDIAQLYDGFTILTLLWLEALNLVAPGESGPFVEGGSRIALDGVLPVNTGGGQLSAGRLHGFGHLHEAVLQLRGDAGARQVPRAPRTAVVAAGGGHLAGALLLVRD
jgi:acetyl-CoA acetyltransferase